MLPVWACALREGWVVSELAILRCCGFCLSYDAASFVVGTFDNPPRCTVRLVNHMAVAIPTFP